MSTTYRLDDEPAATRLDYFRNLLSERSDPLDIQPARGTRFHAHVVAGDVGALRVTQVTGSAGACFRTRRHIRRSDPGNYGVCLVTRGHAIVDHGGRRARLGPGDFHLVDSSQPLRHAHPAIQMMVISFPRTLLPLRPTDVAKVLGVRMPGDHGVSALASALVRQLPRHLDDASPAGGARLGTTVLDLLTVAVTERLDSSGAHGEAARRALLPRVYAFVEERLADPELTPGEIATAHHISVRYLHKLFQAQGRTVAGWIRERRLERCRQDLLDPTLAARSVSATAARWGFGNDAHFNRAFRAAYGLPPGEYRAAHNGTFHQ